MYREWGRHEKGKIAFKILASLLLAGGRTQGKKNPVQLNSQLCLSGCTVSHEFYLLRAGKEVKMW